MASIARIKNVFVSVTLVAGTNKYDITIKGVGFIPDEFHFVQFESIMTNGASTAHYVETNLVPESGAVLGMFDPDLSKNSPICPFKWGKTEPNGTYSIFVRELDGSNNAMAGTLGMYMRFIKYKDV